MSLPLKRGYQIFVIGITLWIHSFDFFLALYMSNYCGNKTQKWIKETPLLPLKTESLVEKRYYRKIVQLMFIKTNMLIKKKHKDSNEKEQGALPSCSVISSAIKLMSPN